MRIAEWRGARRAPKEVKSRKLEIVGASLVSRECLPMQNPKKNYRSGPPDAGSK
jgi:hypothetical protein